jgi:cephalosporin hydroxylase
VRLLELGVERGDSLRMWRGYFPRGRIVGVDVKPKAASFAEGFDVVIGSQDDPDTISRAVELLGGEVDVVIDDASHMPGPTLASLQLLWPHLSAGGYYFVEDVHVAYERKWQEWLAGRNVVADLADHVADMHTPDGLPGLASVAFYWRLCLLRKR